MLSAGTESTSDQPRLRSRMKPSMGSTR
jgi:hypothetical protein